MTYMPISVKKFKALYDVICQVFCDDVNITGLMDTLFENYHKDVRPLCDSGSAVKVKVGMALRQVIDLRWHDCDLKWNGTEFGADNIIIPVNRIWIPDITLYDNVGDQLSGLKDYRPVVSSNGDISYNFPTVITSMCPVDVTFFPFDTQNCLLKFGSWAYHGYEVDIINLSDTGDISSFVPSVEWSVVGIPAVRHVTLYGCCPEPYPDVTFYVVLDRKPLFYMMSLIFPCMLITAVACLGFMLPPDSGEKVSLEITVLLSLAVFLLVVSETMPPSSENFPYIGVYFACSMLLVSFSCLMTVIVLSMHYKGIHGREMPQIVKTIFFDYIAKFVCMTTVRRRARRCSIHPVSPLYQTGPVFTYSNDAFLQNGIPKSETNGKVDPNGLTTMVEELNADNAQRMDDNYNESATSDIIITLQKQLQIIKNIEKNLQEKKRIDSIIEEWQLLAIVLDRVFLLFFFLFMTVSTLAIILRSAQV
ncbi:Neuronal acetylcholine receptor subunit alpha-9-I,Neuronal acetylcholine receptor subunit alpha-9-II [Mytilus coruscus]|uniref:Neuronal acetylcholine receptor subunit alpha-9-I,Neuronal acetylcholine receptor subunit alpha-9-II n=1 Tax=Mytilus coruscus TaxID=42192 RepID=A0A6J8DR44_MYTCO|nr:Neuronal acetylcholine receptor subunit alpha-9-I,Neuronal acetylcholine receptor subunit alpha-9-II [Mytilus coruscus]